VSEDYSRAIELYREFLDSLSFYRLEKFKQLPIDFHLLKSNFEMVSVILNVML
jgi:hypothetical protein